MKKSDASFRSLRYSGSLLGVDLGSHTIKVIQLKVVNGRVSVVARAEREVWAQLAEAKTEAQRKEILAQALRELLKSSRFTDKRAAISLSGLHSVVKFARLTKDFKKDPRTGIPEEAKGLSPFDANDTLLDARLHEDPHHEGGPEMMAVMAQRHAINDRLGVVRKARLRPAVVLNDALALENAYGFLAPKDQFEPVVIVDLGATTTTVSIVENGVLRAARSFNIAGDALTRAIRRDLTVSLEEAESLKKEYGLFGHRMANESRVSGHNEAYRIYNETSVRVYRAIKPSVKDLCTGIQRTIDGFMERRRPELPPVSRVLLAGGTAQLRNLEEVVRAETGLPVDVFEPLGKRPIAADGAEGPSSAALAVVYGLGLAGALRSRSAKPRINLLPVEAKRAAAVRNAARVLLLAGGALFILLGSAGLYHDHAQKVADDEAKAETQLKAATPVKAAPKVKAPPAPPAKPVSPFAWLGSLRVAGAFGNVVMLSGSKGSFTATEGRLMDEGGTAVPGVAVHLGSKAVVLTGGGETHKIDLP